jgi:hypothetical protein
MARSFNARASAISMTCRTFANVQHAGSEPRFDDDDAVGREVTAKPMKRRDNAGHGPKVSDGAEQARDDVVSMRQFEITHVRLEEAGVGHLSPGNGQELRIDIESVRDEPAGAKMLDVFPGATSHIEQPFGGGMIGANDRRDRIRLARVVLEGAIDRVIQLRGLRKHSLSG